MSAIRLDVGVLHHLLPYAELNLDESCQFLRRAGKSLDPTFLNLAWTSGLSMISRSDVLSFFTTAAGVPAGAT
jgi:hypothetical protein